MKDVSFVAVLAHLARLSAHSYKCMSVLTSFRGLSTHQAAQQKAYKLQKHNLRGQVIVTVTVVLLRTSLFSKKSSPRFAIEREVIIFPYQQVDYLLGDYLDNNKLAPNFPMLSS